MKLFSTLSIYIDFPMLLRLLSCLICCIHVGKIIVLKTLKINRTLFCALAFYTSLICISNLPLQTKGSPHPANRATSSPKSPIGPPQPGSLCSLHVCSFQDGEVGYHNLSILGCLMSWVLLLATLLCCFLSEEENVLHYNIRLGWYINF
jgi:hypothetical protein